MTIKVMRDKERAGQLLDDATGEIIEDVDIRREFCVGALAAAFASKEEEKDAKKGYTRAMLAIRAFQEDHPEEQLYDGENELALQVTPKKAGRGFDMPRLAQDDPTVIVELARHGLLAIDWKAWDAQKAAQHEFVEFTRARKFEAPAGYGNPALQVVKGKLEDVR